ncbi:MAG: hypothetical protein AAGC68_05260, partial [Verrucomicrobiota bacterium]
PPPQTDQDLRDYLKGTQWKMSGNKVLTFQKSGEVHKSWGKLRPKWKVEEMRVIYEGKVFEFSEDFTEIRLISGRNDAGKLGLLVKR